MIFRKDIRPVVAGMNDAILRWKGDQDTAACIDRLWVLAGQIPTLTDRKTFVGQVRKVLALGRPDMATSLICVMGPYDWAPWAYLTARVVWPLLKLSVLVALIVGVLRCL